MVCAGPPWAGNSNLMIPVIAAAAAAGAPFGCGLLGRRRLPGVRAVELGVPVAEQARVLLVLVIPPEVLERAGVVDLGLGRPGGRDLRAVEAVARPHRGGARTARARSGQDLADRGVRMEPRIGGSGWKRAVSQGVHPGAVGRGEQPDLAGRGAEEASGLGARTRRERRTRLTARSRPGTAHPPGAALRGLWC